MLALRSSHFTLAAVIIAAFAVPSCTPTKSGALRKWEEEHRLASPFIGMRPIWPAEWDGEDNNVTIRGAKTWTWKAAFKRKLREPISFDFVDTPLDDVVAFLRGIHMVSIVVDKGAIRQEEDIRVTLLVEKVPFGEGLERILKPHGLGYTLENGAIFITTREELSKCPKLPTVGYDAGEWKAVRGSMNKPVSGEFVRASLDDVITLLRDRAKLKIIYLVDVPKRPKAGPFPKGTSWLAFKFRHMKAKFVLAWACHQLDLAYTVKDGAFLITTPEAVRDKDYRRGGVYFSRPKPIWPVEWRKEKNTIPVRGTVGPGWPEAFAERLKQPVSFDFIDTPLDDVIAFLRNSSQVSFVVDTRGTEWRSDRVVTLQLERVRFLDALEWTLRLQGYGYAVTDGAIFITTRERLALWEKAPTAAYDAKKWKPVEAAMNKPISFDFRRISIDDFLTFLRGRTKLDITLNDDARPSKIKHISLAVEGMKVKFALGWACHQLDLSYTVKDGKVIIDRSEKIAAVMKAPPARPRVK